MFLSCFGKKKDKKKSKKGKAPSPQPTPKPSSEEIPKTETKRNENPSTEVKVAAEVDNDPGDFSAVPRETEILRPYRKPPPPKNRARQSRAPRAFKGSTESLDIFSEIDEEASLQVSYTSQRDETDRPKVEAKAEVSEDAIAKSPEKPFTSLSPSSMLDDIELTLANLNTETKSEVTEVLTNDLKTKENGEKKAIPGAEKALHDATTKKEVTEMEFKNEATVQLNTVPVVTFDGKAYKKESKERISPPVTTGSGLKEVKEDTGEKVAFNLNEVTEGIETKAASTFNSGVAKLEDVKVKIESTTKVTDWSNKVVSEDTKEAKSVDDEDKHVTANSDNLMDKANSSKEQMKTKVTAVIGDIQETIDDRLGRSTASTKEDDLQQTDFDQEETKVKQTETKINGTLHEVEKASNFFQDLPTAAKTPSPKIPPKVSPKPSPKTSPKPLLIKRDAIQETLSQVSNNTKEEMNSPGEPASPTSPISPTQPTKSQSRIPMSKKTSAIPKLSLSSSKSSSVSPVSSPDSSMAKKVDQTSINSPKEEENIIDQVKELAHKAADNLTQNNKETGVRNSKEKSPEPEKNNSPFERENRGSKSRLTKLRYSGRKSADTNAKSDESESERGSRAGSEAKSEDDKKVSEDDKSSRIPVRAGSKPRSSPPKTSAE